MITDAGLIAAALSVGGMRGGSGIRRSSYWSSSNWGIRGE